ncbi:unnamed protein product [Amoebophrya sp. A120]|nr:unnamed protein product [Amoebophrya sp. A120]|eukprot:GSA120T00016712001.1
MADPSLQEDRLVEQRLAQVPSARRSDWRWWKEEGMCKALQYSDDTPGAHCVCPFGIGMPADVSWTDYSITANTPCATATDKEGCDAMAASPVDAVRRWECVWKPFVYRAVAMSERSPPVGGGEEHQLQQTVVPLLRYGACVSQGDAHPRSIAMPGIALQSFCALSAYVPILLAALIFLKFLFRRSTTQLFNLGFLLVLVSVNELGIKKLMRQARPQESCAGNFGMPSGHSAVAVGLLTVKLLQLLYRTEFGAQRHTGQIRQVREEMLAQLAEKMRSRLDVVSPSDSVIFPNEILDDVEKGRTLGGAQDEESGSLSSETENFLTDIGANEEVEEKDLATRKYEQSVLADPLLTSSRHQRQTQKMRHPLSKTLASKKTRKGRPGSTSAALTVGRSTPSDGDGGTTRQPRPLPEADGSSSCSRCLRRFRRDCSFAFAQLTRAFFGHFKSSYCTDEGDEVISHAEAAFWTTVWIVSLVPVGPCRAILRDHTPAQVIVGMLMGMLVGICWFRLSKLIANLNTQRIGYRYCDVLHDMAPPFYEYRSQLRTHMLPLVRSAQLESREQREAEALNLLRQLEWYREQRKNACLDTLQRLIQKSKDNQDHSGSFAEVLAREEKLQEVVSLEKEVVKAFDLQMTLEEALRVLPVKQFNAQFPAPDEDARFPHDAANEQEDHDHLLHDKSPPVGDGKNTEEKLVALSQDVTSWPGGDQHSTTPGVRIPTITTHSEDDHDTPLLLDHEIGNLNRV